MRYVHLGPALALAVLGGWSPLSAADPAGGPPRRPTATLGVRLVPAEDGVQIGGIVAGSPADKAGLQVGDVIRSAGRQRMREPQAFAEWVRRQTPGAVVDLAIVRSGAELTVRAPLGTETVVFEQRRRSNSIAPAAEPAPLANPASTGQRFEEHVRSLEQQVEKLQQELDRARALQEGRRGGE